MNQVNKIGLIRWGVIIFFLLTIMMNYFAQVDPFNGQTNGEVSDKYATLITPADYAFSIWGIIFLSLGVYVYYQALWASREKQIFERINKWLILSFTFTCLWLPVFQYEMLALSVLVMLCLLLSLVKTTAILIKDSSMSVQDRSWIKIPIGMYLGWVSVATIVNISVLLKYAYWDLFNMSELYWLWIMIIIGFILAVVVDFMAENIVIPLVFSWAFVAIALKHNQTEVTYIFGLIMAVLLFLFSVFFGFRLPKKKIKAYFFK